MLNIIPALVGFFVFFGAMKFLLKSSARRWNQLAEEYSVEGPTENLSQRRMQNLILFGGVIGYNSYIGISTVGITSEGLSLSLLPPWSIYHPPLLIPFEDLSLRETSWYLNVRSYKYTCSKVDNIELILDEKLVKWIETNSPLCTTRSDVLEFVASLEGESSHLTTSEPT